VKALSNPDAKLERAVAALRNGQLVAFPTETVYGLGADATNADAVRKIFEVKGRPDNHPLIVHLSEAGELTRWASAVPKAAWQLAEAFWPGPLTLVLPKSVRVPDVTTGGLSSVGLRVPAHPVALELLRRFGGPVAAPSANRFGRVSPTQAEHVATDLGADVEVVLDGGACRVGLESTIVDLTSGAPVLLRPGGITTARIEEVPGVAVSRQPASETRAPGMLQSHYAPRARVEVVEPSDIARRAHALVAQGKSVALLLLTPIADGGDLSSFPDGALLLDVGKDAREAAQQFYAALRRADAANADVILASPPALQGLGEALADRLRKASGTRTSTPTPT